MASKRCVGAGLVAGAIGGLAASWVMNVFMENAGAKVQQVAEKFDPSAPKHGSESQSSSNEDAPKEDATMKAADAVVSSATGGRHLSLEAKKKGGPVVHYAFGALMGALYGVAAEYWPAARSGFGTTFGSVLFTGADLWAVPKLGLSGSTSDAPVSSLATPAAAHLVYGATTEGVRRVVRALL